MEDQANSESGDADSIIRNLELAAIKRGVGDDNGYLRDLMEDAAAKLRQLSLGWERLQAIIDWADLAESNPDEFDGHGIKNLRGPVFDFARSVLKERISPRIQESESKA